ncbi:MAG: hypothetical protein DI628_03560 [Blastochloris viridis]|uniref:Uncharacterized protein n=1 Tax=Blastochloris viridis TaxID=1079 RepID=A0A6N4R4H3_BLAVI|nr:MAG: hypothetical protein DI628_03560 [Blastochloris viridis]
MPRTRLKRPKARIQFGFLFDDAHHVPLKFQVLSAITGLYQHELALEAFNDLFEKYGHLLKNIDKQIVSANKQLTAR